ncbi:hypothetical protein [Niabella beijingensis]|uniref:hypothetical protein n=1 Tax=Niabella beijingensis TaxID=2872700 RepID=UPI001CC16903|nr:hypothetical protein [Niabella beijingensis]MBZ4187444.1 hypothetical protein [Niabella beijingensis]
MMRKGEPQMGADFLVGYHACKGGQELQYTAARYTPDPFPSPLLRPGSVRAGPYI